MLDAGKLKYKILHSEKRVSQILQIAIPEYWDTVLVD